MWKLAGHITQVVHWLLAISFLVLSMPFFPLNPSYRLPVVLLWTGAVLVSGAIFEDCIITIASNWFFQKGDHPGYKNALAWMSNRKRPHREIIATVSSKAALS
jgi:hypothetical protein